MKLVRIKDDVNIRPDLRGQRAHVLQKGALNVRLRVYNNDGNWLDSVWINKKWVTFPQKEKVLEMATVRINNTAPVDGRYKGREARVVENNGSYLRLRAYDNVGNPIIGEIDVAKNHVTFPQDRKDAEMRLVKIKDIDKVTDPNIRGKLAHVLRHYDGRVDVRIYDDNDIVIPNRSDWTLHENFVEDYDESPTPFRHPAGKTRWDLIPWAALEEVADVFTDAAETGKYEAHSWRTEPRAWSYYYAAALRHITKWWAGETRDAEDKCHSLAYAAARLLMLLELEALRPEDDDRPAIATTGNGIPPDIDPDEEEARAAAQSEYDQKNKENTNGDEDDQE